MASYTLSLVSRRSPAGSFIADPVFLAAQQLLFTAFPDHSNALVAALHSRNPQLWNYSNGALVGAAITSHPTPLEGELHFFAVAPEAQKQGVGRAFYEALEARAFTNQARVTAVSYVPGFFERIGFVNKGPTHTPVGCLDHYLIKVK